MVFPEKRPVLLVVEGDGGQSRLTALFRPFLTLPHLVWLAMWGIAVLPAAAGAWILGGVLGSVPSGLRRFLGSYVRYAAHVVGYLCLVGRRFPGFTGRVSSYEIDVEIDPPTRQSRWGVLLRPLLVIPALAVGCLVLGLLVVAAALSWPFACLAGRVPDRLRNLGSWCMRYEAQTAAYAVFCTDGYPRSARSIGAAQ